jgi:TRAP-type uncharacterized transport system substrate-binding protein
MQSGMPQWLRVALVTGCVLLAIGGGLFAYRYFKQPVTLTVAAGSIDGDAAGMMSALARRLASTGSEVRLKVVEKSNALESAHAFAKGEVDLAIVRGDLADSSAARAVVRVTRGVVLIIVPPGSAIEGMDDLEDVTVGVVGGEINHRVVEVLTKEYDLARAKVRFKDLALSDVQRALKSKEVTALLVVMPLTEKYLSVVRNFFQRNAKKSLALIPIEAAGAIAEVAPAYESYDLPKGTIRGSPAVPDDDLTTLRLSYYLVANSKLSNDRVSDLAEAIMAARRGLIGEYPLLAQIGAPSTDKDAYMPIHPGAAAYFGDDEKTFFDKYGDQFFYGSMLLGSLMSLLAGAWKFMGIGDKQEGPLNPLYSLVDRIRGARDESDLAAVEEEIDNILKAELARYSKGDSQAADAAALGLAANRLEHLINHRRSALQSHAPTARAG